METVIFLDVVGQAAVALTSSPSAVRRLTATMPVSVTKTRELVYITLDGGSSFVSVSMAEDISNQQVKSKWHEEEHWYDALNALRHALALSQRT